MSLSYRPGLKAGVHLLILSEEYIRRISLSSLSFCLVIFSSIFLLPAISRPAEVTLAWSPSTDGKVAGYMVHYGPPGQDSEFQVNAGKETEITLKHLREGASYTFSVKTYDAAGRESTYSHKTTLLNLKDKDTHFLPIIPAMGPSPSRLPAPPIQEKPFPDTPPGCQFTLLPASQSIGSSGGGGSVDISTKLSCPWTAVANVPWVIITSNSSGIGSKVVYYLVKANPNATSREGTLALAGETFKIFQAGRMQYTLNLTKFGSGEGTITSLPPGATFEAGTVVTLKATPAPNSSFAGWSGRCLGTKPICSVTMRSSLSVNAAFKLKTFVIAASAGANGSITPSGRVLVNYGGSQKFTFKARKGYKIGQIRVDGVSVGNPESLLLGNIMNSHKIEANFISIQRQDKR